MPLPPHTPATPQPRFVWFAAVVFLFTWALTTHGKYSVSGDEPHYLMISHSLVTDGDLDLANNYANDDGRFFGHAGLDRGLHAVPARDGRVLSIHDIGTGVALAPVYAVAYQIAQRTSEPLLRRFRMTRGLFAYSLVSLSLIALTTFGVTLLAIGLRGAAGGKATTLLVLVAATSPPIVSHAFLVFPEVLALFVTSVVVWWSLKRTGPRDLHVMLLLGLLLGALPWAHHKFVLYTPGLLFVMGWHRWVWIRSLSVPVIVLAAALYVVPQIGLHVWTWNAWGTLGGALTTQALPFSMSTFKSGVLGLWIDRQSGLVSYAPLYWLLPACAILTWRRSWPFLVPLTFLYLPAAAFVIGWWAGFAPAARYLAPAMPLLLVPLAYSLEHRVVRYAALALCVPQLAIDALVWQRPRLLWPAAEGNRALEMLGPVGRAYEAFLPPLQRDGLTAAAVWVALGWAIVSVCLVAYGRRTGPTPSFAEPSS